MFLILLNCYATLLCYCVQSRSKLSQFLSQFIKSRYCICFCSCTNWHTSKNPFKALFPPTYIPCWLQWRNQPKKLWGPKKLVGAKVYDFRRITLFCLEKRLLKHKMTIFSKNFRGSHGPFGPPLATPMADFIASKFYTVL